MQNNTTNNEKVQADMSADQAAASLSFATMLSEQMMPQTMPTEEEMMPTDGPETQGTVTESEETPQAEETVIEEETEPTEEPIEPNEQEEPLTREDIREIVGEKISKLGEELKTLLENQTKDEK